MLEVKGMPILVDETEVLYTIRDQVSQQQGREILPYAESLGLGTRDYELIDID